MYSGNNNPRHLDERHFTARVGQYANFSAYLAFYEHAVERLYCNVSEHNETADMAGIPLLFLMRHTMELGYKFSLFHLCELNGTLFSPEAPGCEGHSFEKLHKRLRLEYSKACMADHVSEKDHDVIEEYFTSTEKTIQLFDSLDKKSTKFRYPIDKQMPVFPQGTEINLLEMKTAYDQAMGLLGTVIDMIARPWVYYGGP